MIEKVRALATCAGEASRGREIATCLTALVCALYASLTLVDKDGLLH